MHLSKWGKDMVLGLGRGGEQGASRVGIFHSGAGLGRPPLEGGGGTGRLASAKNNRSFNISDSELL